MSEQKSQQPQSSNKVTHYADDNALLEQYRDDDGALVFALKLHDTGEIKTGVSGHTVDGAFMSPLADAFITGKGVVLPPAPHSEPQTTETLFADLLAFMPRHVTWTREFLVGAVAYTMASWVYERFQFFGCAQFVGPQGSGKTRSLDVLGALCYHGAKLCEPTAPVLFRLVSRYHPTLLIDEIDASMRGDLRAVMRNGTNRGGGVVRCRPDDYAPQFYPCYSPKVYAGQEPITDAALAGRMIQENMAEVTPASWIGPTLDKSFESDARVLRSRLLRWALDHFWTIDAVDPGGDDLRQRQVFAPLFTVTPTTYQADLHSLMARQGKAARRSIGDTHDGEVVAALHKLGSPAKVRPIDIARAVTEARGVEFEFDPRNPERMSAERAGHSLKRLGVLDGGRDNQGRFYTVTTDLYERLFRGYLPDASAAPGDGLTAVTVQ